MKRFAGLRVSRVSGTQNTFFIVNVFDPDWTEIYSKWTPSEKSEFAVYLCGGFYDLHTDGLLYLRPEKKFDFAWDFFNADGSHAEMCGNAARCATYLFHEKVASRKTLRFLTGAGEITGEVLSPELVRIEMTAISRSRRMTVLGQEGFYINTGVPHFIIEGAPNSEFARKLRQVPDFGPPGSNITFVQNLTSISVQAVTFERGVEDFTRACGTGAVAAAMYLQDAKGPQNSIEVHMPGGVLMIENARTEKRPFLTGPVQYEFDLELK